MTTTASDTIDRQVISGTGPYAYSFRIFDEGDLSVAVDTGDLNYVPLTIDTHYTVSDVNDEAGGTITLTAAIAAAYAGDTIDIRSNVPKNQPTSFRNIGRFNNETHEAAMDRLSRQVQDLTRIVNRCLRLPDSHLTSGEFTPLANWAERYPFVNADGDIEPAQIIAVALSQSSFDQFLNGSGPFARTAAEIAASVTPANYAYLPGNVLRYGINTTPGTTDMTSAIQAAHNQGDQATGIRPYLPSGTYLITSTIEPCRLGMYGDGPAKSIINCNNCNLFTIPSDAGWDRPQAVFEKFAVNSNDGTSCDDNWAFYFTGVASGAAPVYNSGFIARDIAIGRSARMGGGFRIKDVFGAKVENISMTDVTRAVQLVGSVVQSTFTSIDALLGDDGPGSALSSIGFSTESATYSGASTLTPEHITTADLSLIGLFDTGLQHTAGFDCNFYDTDLQTAVTGMSLNAPCDVKGGVIIPHSSGVTGWVGVLFGVSPGTKDARYVENVDVTIGNTPGTVASSYGFDIGDGVSPCFGVFIKNCRIKGNAASLQSLIRGRICKELEISSCVMEAATAASTEVSIASSQRVEMRFNHCAGGIFAIGDGGDATATGCVEYNQITTLTMSPMTTRSNWRIDINDAIRRFAYGVANIGDGGTIAHGLSSTPTFFQACATQSGEFSSVTSVSSTNLTVAIKTHAGAAGTTQNIHWQAGY